MIIAQFAVCIIARGQTVRAPVESQPNAVCVRSGVDGTIHLGFIYPCRLFVSPKECTIVADATDTCSRRTSWGSWSALARTTQARRLHKKLELSGFAFNDPGFRKKRISLPAIVADLRHPLRLNDLIAAANRCGCCIVLLLVCSSHLALQLRAAEQCLRRGLAPEYPLFLDQETSFLFPEEGMPLPACDDASISLKAASQDLMDPNMTKIVVNYHRRFVQARSNRLTDETYRFGLSINRFWHSGRTF